MARPTPPETGTDREPMRQLRVSYVLVAWVVASLVIVVVGLVR